VLWRQGSADNLRALQKTRCRLSAVEDLTCTLHLTLESSHRPHEDIISSIDTLRGGTNGALTIHTWHRPVLRTVQMPHASLEVLMRALPWPCCRTGYAL